MSDTTRIFQRVRDAARIEDLIGEYITLRPAGRELVGLCPFH
ncbi:MAG: CHC2 zinc finger domain-containing protein, partial [Planctomycetes bacterium]|nr:CHC2 zinc finger domain-containing protein [Planctomycetota bacterium]